MTSLAQRSWDAFSAEDREERRALGGLTLKMYDEAEVPLDHALRHWSYREFPRDLGHISKIYNGEVIGSYLEAGGNPDATLYGGTYTMLGLYLIRPRAAKSGGVRTIWTRRPLAAGFDTRPWSSTVAPTANGSAGAAAGAATGAAAGATARGTRVVRLKRERGAAAKLNGAESMEALVSANNWGSSLVDLRRFEEAKSMLREMIPVARRVIGDNHELTIRLGWNYTMALCEDPAATLGDLREAVATFEKTIRVTRRVFGGENPLTRGIERSLQKARVALRARETPSPGGGSA